jgi:3-hydroxyisobutyrate dehydrogenase-like beta-hydroxyacid dehydrogenase
MKLAVNLGMAVYLQSLAESFAMGEAEGLSVEQMLDVFADSPTASPFLKGKMGVLKGEAAPVSLDLRTLRKDVMSAVGTGALGGVPMPAGSGALTTLSAAVANGWGERDLAELPRWFRQFLPQVYD